MYIVTPVDIMKNTTDVSLAWNKNRLSFEGIAVDSFNMGGTNEEGIFSIVDLVLVISTPSLDVSYMTKPHHFPSPLKTVQSDLAGKELLHDSLLD